MEERTFGHAFPRYLTSFVGRGQDVEELSRLVGDARFVCLVGLGGVGKTRLAAVVAERVSERFTHGVIAVDVEGVSTPTVMCDRIAAALRLREGQAPASDAIARVLRGRRVLLILDGCEALDDASALVLQQLLESTGQLSILATSRRMLRIHGAYHASVLPLPVPPVEEASTWSLAMAEGSAAVRLFVDRARLVTPAFLLTERNVGAVGTLCQRLEGLPLAIELAASWVRALSVDEIVERLEGSHRFLARRTETVPQRHRSLDGLVADTFSLCSHDEQVLWRRMAVFDGSFNLAAVEAVCGSPPLDSDGVLETLGDLVDGSVLTVEHIGDRSRYRLPRIARDYVRARDGEMEAVEERHHAHFATVVEAATQGWSGPGHLALLDELRLDYANIVQAIESGFRHPHLARTSMRMATDMWPMWIMLGRLSAGRRLLRQAAGTATAAAHPTERAVALSAAAYVCVLQGEIHEARELNSAASPARDPSLGAALSLEVAAMIEMSVGRWDACAKLLDRAVDLYGQLDDPRSAVLLIGALGLSVTAAALRGDSARAQTLGSHALSICDEHGDVVWRGYVLYGLGIDAWRQGDYAGAFEVTRKALTSSDELLIAHCVELLAWCAASAGADHDRAARLFGAAHRRWSYLGGPFSGFSSISQHHEQWTAATRAELGASYQDAHREGAALTWTEIMDEVAALGVDLSAGGTTTPEPKGPLTSREFEVAGLIARGLSNRAIAAALGISIRTAESHVDHILTKLQVPNRTRVAGWFLQRVGHSG